MTPRRPRPDQRGAAGPFLFTGLLAVLVLAGLAWWTFGGPESSSATGDGIERQATASSQELENGGPATLDEPPTDGPRNLSGIEVGAPTGVGPMDRLYGDPSGTIAGEIKCDESIYPETWTVTVEPSIFGAGRQEATTRTFVAEPGMRSFEIQNLPLAGYRVSATAPGLASKSAEVLLYKIKGQEHLPGMNYVHIDLTLRPAARLEGAVRTANGDVAPDLAVYLVPKGAVGSADSVGENAAVGELDRVRLEGRTNPSGSYRFDGLMPGDYLVFLGDALRPITPPVPVRMGTDNVVLDDIQLPTLATLRIVVYDRLARPCPDVKLTGYLRGAGAGSFKITTDAVGEAAIPYLTPGPWRVEGSYPPLEQTGRLDVALDPEARDENGLPPLQELHIN